MPSDTLPCLKAHFEASFNVIDRTRHILRRLSETGAPRFRAAGSNTLKISLARVSTDPDRLHWPGQLYCHSSFFEPPAEQHRKRLQEVYYKLQTAVGQSHAFVEACLKPLETHTQIDGARLVFLDFYVVVVDARLPHSESTQYILSDCVLSYSDSELDALCTQIKEEWVTAEAKLVEERKAYQRKHDLEELARLQEKYGDQAAAPSP